jgi:hypothetical protein
VGDHRLEPFRLRCHPPVPLFSLCAHFFFISHFLFFRGGWFEMLEEEEEVSPGLMAPLFLIVRWLDLIGASIY